MTPLTRMITAAVPENLFDESAKSWKEVSSPLRYAIASDCTNASGDMRYSSSSAERCRPAVCKRFVTIVLHAASRVPRRVIRKPRRVK